MRNMSEFVINRARNEDIIDSPEWFQTMVGRSNSISLEKWSEKYSTEIRTEDLYTRNGDSSFEEVDDYTLVITDDEEEFPITTATDRYNLIQNSEVVSQLLQVIDYFNIGVVGFVRDYKSKAVIDIYPSHNLVLFDNPDVDEALSFGLEIRIGHDKTESVKARPILRDSYSQSTIRGLGDWLRLKHVKPEDVDSKDISTRMYKMFSEAFFELGYLSSSYLDSVRRACETEIDFSTESFTIEEFYDEWLYESYIPKKVRNVAPRKALVRAGIVDELVEEIPEDNKIDMWSIVSGYTYALSNVSNTTDGYTKDSMHNKASQALNHPEELIESVRKSYNMDSPEEESEDIEGKAATIISDLEDF